MFSVDLMTFEYFVIQSNNSLYLKLVPIILSNNYLDKMLNIKISTHVWTKPGYILSTFTNNWSSNLQFQHESMLKKPSNDP